MTLWERLTQDQSTSETTPDDTERSLTDELVDLHRRRSDCELDIDIDPTFVLLAPMGCRRSRHHDAARRPVAVRDERFLG